MLPLIRLLVSVPGTQPISVSIEHKTIYTGLRANYNKGKLALPVISVASGTDGTLMIDLI